jgi:hypothetical protein
MNNQTMVHIDFPAGLWLIEKLYNDKFLDCAEVTLRPPFTSCQSHQNGVVKVPKNMCFTVVMCRYPDMTAGDLMPMWNAMLAGGAKVTWKCNNVGHSIGWNGELLETWELDDGGC